MQARVKDVNGTKIITGGPSPAKMNCGLNEKIVPANVDYPEMTSPILYMYTGPTITIAADGESVDVKYTVVEKSIEAIKADLLAPFGAVFDEIDKRSLRAVRSILTAQAGGGEADPKDIETASFYETGAVTNRAMVAEINAATEFSFFQENYQRLVPFKPWDAIMVEVPAEETPEAPVEEPPVEEPVV